MINRHLYCLDIYFPWWKKTFDTQTCSVETLKYNISLFCIIIHLYIIRWLNQWIMWQFNVLCHVTFHYNLSRDNSMSCVMLHFTITYHVTIHCHVSCDISLLLIMWQFIVLYHVTIHNMNMLSCDKSLYYYLIKYLQTYMSRTKGHNLYIVNLFISRINKPKCYRILIHPPKARVSNGR